MIFKQTEPEYTTIIQSETSRGIIQSESGRGNLSLSAILLRHLHIYSDHRAQNILTKHRFLTCKAFYLLLASEFLCLPVFSQRGEFFYIPSCFKTHDFLSPSEYREFFRFFPIQWKHMVAIGCQVAKMSNKRTIKVVHMVCVHNLQNPTTALYEDDFSSSKAFKSHLQSHTFKNGALTSSLVF